MCISYRGDGDDDGIEPLESNPLQLPQFRLDFPQPEGWIRIGLERELRTAETSVRNEGTNQTKSIIILLEKLIIENFTTILTRQVLIL